MYNLELAINLDNWRIFSGRKKDVRFHPIQKKVWARDNCTCQYCGFQAKEYQEVVNLDGDYRNNQLQNLMTSCVFCTQVAFLSVIGTGYGGGKLIYLPEMSQSELNSFCHVIFCAMTNKTGYLETAQTAYRNFRFRTKPVEAKFGAGTSNPSVFCQLLLNNDTFNPQLVHKIFKDIRLLPTYAKFKQELETWAEAAVEELSQDG
jgi:intracellular multiplication protein IcmJ